MGQLPRLLLLALALHSATSDQSAQSCPCSTSGIGHVLLFDYGLCWLVPNATMTLEMALGHAASTLVEQCMRHYTLAATADVHVRITVAQRLAAALQGMQEFARLRLSLARPDNTQEWQWITASGNITLDNATASAMWQGGSQWHTSAVLDVASGQLMTADHNESMPGLWHAKPASGNRMCRTVETADNAPVPHYAEITLPSASATAASHQCAAHCHKSTNCLSYTVAYETNDNAYRCYLMDRIDGHGLSLRNYQRDGMEFCTMSPYEGKPCELPQIANATVSVDGQSDTSSSTYAPGSTVTVRCNEGTHFANGERAVQLTCALGQLWAGWSDAYCNDMPTRIWSFHIASEQQSWQEYTPGRPGVAVDNALPLRSGDNGNYHIAINYKDAVYLFTTSDVEEECNVHRIDTTDYTVTQLAGFGDYARVRSAGAHVDNVVLICGGVTSSGSVTSSCFTYDVETGSAAWAWESMPQAKSWHCMCAFRRRYYAVADQTYQTVYSIDGGLGQAAWREEAELPERRIKTACHAHNDALYVCGGSLSTNYDTCQSYDGSTWTALPDRLPQGVKGGALLVLQGSLCYVGGYTDSGGQTTVAKMNATGQWHYEPYTFRYMVVYAAVVAA